jgi:hypothetical protein
MPHDAAAAAAAAAAALASGNCATCSGADGMAQ